MFIIVQNCTRIIFKTRQALAADGLLKVVKLILIPAK